MRWMARCARSMTQRVRTLTVLSTAVVYGTVLVIPASVGAAEITHRPGGPAPRPLPTVSSTGQAFSGVAAVGALFTVSAGRLGTHFCTASIVRSVHGDLAVTAAHCVTGNQGQIVFVPGYNNGKEPYGVWPVTAVYTNQAWRSSQDPDD